MERFDHPSGPSPERESAAAQPRQQAVRAGEQPPALGLDESRVLPGPPAAISYRRLEQWLQRAVPDPGAGDSVATSSAQGSERLELLLEHYGRLSQQLLEELASQGEQLRQSHSGRQLMALGALATHLQLGLQALAASRR